VTPNSDAPAPDSARTLAWGRSLKEFSATERDKKRFGTHRPWADAAVPDGDRSSACRICRHATQDCLPGALSSLSAARRSARLSPGLGQLTLDPMSSQPSAACHSRS
jgi:hypothetical protein